MAAARGVGRASLGTEGGEDALLGSVEAAAAAAGVCLQAAGAQWKAAVAAADVTSAVQRAARAAWADERSQAAAAAAVSAGGGSLLQLSAWRHAHPLERAQRPPAHACVDWLHPVSAAVALLETRVLSSAANHLSLWLSDRSDGGCGDQLTIEVSTTGRHAEDDHVSSSHGGGASLAKLLATCQQWRQRLWVATQTDASTAVPVDAVWVYWLHLRKAARLLHEAAPSNALSGHDVAVLTHASEGMDRSLGIPVGADPPSPLLWAHGGHPPMPATAVAQRIESAVRALCTAARVSHASVVGSAAAAAAAMEAEAAAAEAARAGEAEGMIDADGSAIYRRTEKPTDALDADPALLGLVADAATRQSLLEGLCLFQCAQLMHTREHSESTSSSPVQTAEALVQAGSQMLQMLTDQCNMRLADARWTIRDSDSSNPMAEATVTAVVMADPMRPGAAGAAPRVPRSALAAPRARTMALALTPLTELHCLSVELPVLAVTAQWAYAACDALLLDVLPSLAHGMYASD